MDTQSKTLAQQIVDSFQVGRPFHLPAMPVKQFIALIEDCHKIKNAGGDMTVN